MKIVDKKVTTSGRGVLWTNAALYVADEVGDKVYDSSGYFLGGSSVAGPVHLMAVHPALYVCNGADVLTSALNPDSPAHFTLEPIPALRVPHVSGLACDGNDTLYAGSRAQDRKGQGSVYTSPTSRPRRWLDRRVRSPMQPVRALRPG